MFVEKLRLPVSFIAVSALLVGGVIAWGSGPSPAPAAANPASAEPRQPAQEKKEPTARDKELAKVAGEVYEFEWKHFLTGAIVLQSLSPWSVNWLKAELRLSETKAKTVEAYERHLERTHKAEKILNAKFDVGNASKSDCLAATYYRLVAEIWLEEAKAKD